MTNQAFHIIDPFGSSYLVRSFTCLDSFDAYPCVVIIEELFKMVTITYIVAIELIEASYLTFGPVTHPFFSLNMVILVLLMLMTDQPLKNLLYFIFFEPVYERHLLLFSSLS